MEIKQGDTMSVYSKCQGTDCLKRDSCLRFTVPPLVKYQPWLVQIVSVPDTKACKFFIDNGEK